MMWAWHIASSLDQADHSFRHPTPADNQPPPVQEETKTRMIWNPKVMKATKTPGSKQDRQIGQVLPTGSAVAAMVLLEVLVTC